MKKIISLLAVVLLTAFVANANPVSQDEATTVCRNFLMQKKLNGNIETTDFQYYKTEFKNQEAVGYVFTCQPTGFVVVAASTRFEPIVCYSFESDYIHQPGFDYAMEAYANMISYFEKNGKDFHPDLAEKWQRYLSADYVATPTRAVVVEPLVTSKWSQEKFYNTYCPWDAAAGYGSDYRVVTGCVSTAMSQVLNYHGHPHVGAGGSSYIPAPYGRQTVRFYEQTYNYNAMPNRPMGNYANEMAKLIYHCGVAVQMGYSASGSGANSVTASDAMNRHFKYDSAWICSRQLFDEIGEWYSALKVDLDARRPLYYSADNGQVGHAFVLDGYDEDSKFHVNWGWGGSSDGYFTISDNDLSQMNSFIYHAEAIRLAYPITDAPGVAAGFNRVDASNGKFSSGMPTRNYAPNTDCQWMLAAPEASRYVLHFDRFETEQNVDVVTIYNGPTVESGVAGTYSGNTIPADVTINADSVLVTFTTDAQNEYRGFQISYQATTASPYCTDGTINSHTVVTDGSGDAQYRNNTVCTWTITAPGRRCYFSFPQLEFGSGDFIEIYDKTTSPARLLYRFDNRNYPEMDVITCDYNKLSLVFVADNWDTGNGFTVTVEPVTTAINDYAGVNDLHVFPNPVADNLNVNFTTTKAEQIHCQIVDMNGKVVASRQIQHNGGLFEETFDVRDLAKGIYFLRIQSEDGYSMEKFIRQ